MRITRCPAPRIMLQLRLEKDIDVAIGHFDFGVGVVLPRPRRAAPAALPDALLKFALAAGSSSDEPGQPALSKTLENAMILEDWKLLAANLTCTSQWLNLVASPRDLLAWIGGDTRDGPAVQPSHDFVDYRSWEEQTHMHSSTLSHTVCMHAHAQSASAYTRTCTQIHASTRAPNPTRTHADAHACTHKNNHARAHTHTHARARACMCARAQTGGPPRWLPHEIHIQGAGRVQCCAPPPSARLWPRHLLRIVRSDAARLPSMVAPIAAMRWHCAAGGVGSVRRLGALEDGGIGFKAQGLRLSRFRAYGCTA